MSHAVYARGRGGVPAGGEWCSSCPGVNPLANKLDMWSLGFIIQPAVLTCQKGSDLDENMTQHYETECIMEPAIREGTAERTNIVADHAAKLHLWLSVSLHLELSSNMNLQILNLMFDLGLDYNLKSIC